MTTFVQWNIRGLQANREELSLLLSAFDPACVALQETNIGKNHTVNYQNYHFYNTPGSESNGSYHGGSALIINKAIPHKLLSLQTNLQATAARITVYKTITVCSIYLPPSQRWNFLELEDLLSQLPPPALLLGDFNAHSHLWGCRDTNRQGKLIEDFILKQNLCLLNTGVSTYFHSGTGTASAIDLSLCNPSLFLDLSWSVHEDLCGSDHYPIIIRSCNPDGRDALSTWKLDRADWSAFADECSNELTITISETGDDSVKIFTEKLIEIANHTIPKSKAGKRTVNTTWFNDDCKEARKRRRKSLKLANTSPTVENMDNYRILRAKCRRTIRTSRRQSWQAFVSKINTRTSIKKVWNAISKITGKKSSMGIHHLSINNNDITAPSDIANALGHSFSSNSSSEHYSDTFNTHRKEAEKQRLKFKSKNTELYNADFSLDELKLAIDKSSDSAVGPDEVHYQMLKHLPHSALQTLLHTVNKIWSNGTFPSTWQNAVILPILKADKDKTDPCSYRPIALTSCLCKIVERMVNDRLIWYLEKNKIINSVQSGFRKNRSTTDNLVRLESFIREAFIQKQHAVAVFFDLEKAYDTTWKYGIMKDLFNAGLRGRLPLFIQGFLQNRLFQVRLGTHMSDVFNQEMGVPQGSILSVTLFALKINSIVRALSPGVDCSLYVDDFVICYRSKYIHIIERHVQRSLNKLQEWVDTNGFKFSETKTVCVHFCRLRKTHPDPVLILNGTPISVTEQAKFLGLIFDKKLTFLPHLHYLKQKGMKALNLLRVVAHTKWGSDERTLLHLYRSLIRSKLDYGSVVYGSARKSYLRILEPIQNQALRLCVGAFRTSPVTSLHVEANEMPLELRCKQLSSKYVLKVSSDMSNPARSCISNNKFNKLFDKQPGQIRPLGLRVCDDLDDIGFRLKDVLLKSLPPSPPCLTTIPSIDFSLTVFSKLNTSSEIYKSKFFEICENLQGYYHIYTDGSKTNDGTAAAAVSREAVKSIRITEKASIFTAELIALNLSLDIIWHSKHNNFIIFSDSLSGLLSIQNRHFDTGYVQKFIRNYNFLVNSGKTIRLCWIPSHIGIQGNERADKAAKAALSSSITAVKCPPTDYYQCLTTRYQTLWQADWSRCLSNKLHAIKPLLGYCDLTYLSRRDSVVLRRLRIGHTRLTHSYLLNREDQPQCSFCDCALTVTHILLDCHNYDNVRQRYFSVGTLKELFDTINARYILDFLKDISLYHRI